MQLTEIRPWISSQESDIEDTLRNFVELNTYTANTAGVEEGMKRLEALAARLGFATERVNARHCLIRSYVGQGGPRLLLVSHMDTVFPPDGDFLHYEPLEDGLVRGPGTGDIKGGMLLGLWAMRAIRELGIDHDIQMIVSADEETGSPTIRDWYMGGHVSALCAIGLEPGFPQGPLTATVPLGVVDQRRGYGAIRFKVKGKGCHSGTPWLGLNAVEAAAQRVIRIHALNAPERGISVTVGMIHGGTSANTVAGEVEATASFRFERLADGEEIRAAVEAIISERYVHNPDIDLWDSAEYVQEAFIPPMERSEANQRITQVVLQEAERLGHNVLAIARGGGSDANFISASGTPAICGMGAPTEGLHTTTEMIHLPMLFERIELLASTLYRLTTEPEILI